MIERYSRKEMLDMWSNENKFNAWMKVELLSSEAFSKLGVIPKDDIKKLWENCRIDVNRMLELEKEMKHDVVAFTRALSEYLGEEKKWVHIWNNRIIVNPFTNRHHYKKSQYY
ncbi:Adenylosuccinate lyase [Candidatus Arthromitus sp. SFB-3]|nr:Adenylosuccinate lyase [Candidatus Arthromitus sp. SFB-3]